MKAPIIFIAAMTILSACSMKQREAEQVLTIDSTLQAKVTSILESKLEEFDAQSGQAIIMEVQSGQISALVDKDFTTPYRSEMVRCATLSAALETGKVHLSDTIDTGNGVYAIDNDTLLDNNWRRGGYGKLTIKQAFAQNSIIGIYKTMVKAFGGNTEEYLNKVRHLYDTKSLIIFANHGEWAMITPMLSLALVNKIAANTGNDSLKSALRYTVTDGLGMKADTKKVEIAGMSGTTLQEDGSYRAEFCGYFPADNPKYSVIVSINKKGLPASGGAMAGSVFKEIAEYMADELSPDLESLEFRTADTILKTNHKLVMLMDTLYRYTRITPQFLSSTLEDDIEWMNKYRNQLCRYYKANKLGTDTISDYAKADTVIEASRKLWELHSDESTMGLIISLGVEYTRMVFQQYNEYAQLLELCKTNRQKKLLKDEFKAWIDLNDLMCGFCCDCIYLIYCGGTITSPLSLMGMLQILDSHISMYQKDRMLLNGNSDSFNENGVSMECAKNQLLDSCRWALKEYIYDDEMKGYIHEEEERERYEKQTIIAKQKVSELPAVISKWIKARESWANETKRYKERHKKTASEILIDMSNLICSLECRH